jgi:hypothetical protein
MRRAIYLAVVVVLTGSIGLAVAQPRGPVLRVEPDTRTEFSRPGFVTGWVYNDGQGIVGLVRMKVEMLDESGARVAEHIGWAYGNVSPGGRAYFMIPIPPRSSPNRRVTVESFVLQSLEGPSQSP